MGTTWSATQLGPRPVKPGLGGHDDGVWGVDDGVENTSHLLWKRMRTAVSECATFSDFTDVETDLVNENREYKNISRQSRNALLNLQCRFIHLSCKREISKGKSRKFYCLV